MSVACAGFIIAGADKNIRWGRKKVRWGRITPGGLEIFFCPPLKKILPLGQNRQEGGGRKREKHLIIENKGREPN